MCLRLKASRWWLQLIHVFLGDMLGQAKPAKMAAVQSAVHRVRPFKNIYLFRFNGKSKTWSWTIAMGQDMVSWTFTHQSMRDYLGFTSGRNTLSWYTLLSQPSGTASYAAFSRSTAITWTRLQDTVPFGLVNDKTPRTVRLTVEPWPVG